MNISDPYEGFSKIFDKVVSKAKYDKWEAWIQAVWAKNNFSPKTILDIACGTGINAIRLSKLGIDVYGVDSSESMLEQARKKNSEIKFLKGHFLNFSIPSKVDGAICFDFSTNYILRSNEFIDFLNRVYDVLNENAIFIFDFKPAQAFFKKEKHLQEADFTFDWTCNIRHEPFVIVDMKISLATGEVFNERHIERGYNLDEIMQIIKSTKFKILEIYDNCELKTPDENSELIQCVLRK